MSLWNYIGGFLFFRWLLGGRNVNDGATVGRRNNMGGIMHLRGGIEDYSDCRPDDEDDALDDYDLTDCDDCFSDDFTDEPDDDF